MIVAFKEVDVAHTLSIKQTIGRAIGAERVKLALIRPRTRVLRVTRIRFDENDRPLALEEIVLPLDRLPSLAANGADVPDILELALRHGLTLGQATERVGMVPATTEVALHLRIVSGTAVVMLDRVTETVEGVPIEWRVAYCV